MATKQITEVDVTWMVRQDLDDVMRIERLSFPYPWTEEEMMSCLRRPNCIGMVARRGNVVAGFMLYELLRSQLHVINFAVHPEFRRQEVGSQMVDKLLAKLAQQGRTEIVLEVRERNLAAQLFFRRTGFVSAGVIRNYYDDTDEDAYRLVRGLWVSEVLTDDNGKFIQMNIREGIE